MTNSEIRSGTTADLDELAALYDALNNQLAQTQNFPGWVKDEYPVRETAAQGIKEQTLFVFTNDKTIAGTIILNHKPEASYHQAKWLFESDYSDILVVHTLAVHPDFFQRGIAKRLLEFAEQYGRANQIKSIRLDTFEDNIPAIKLYEKLGYQYIETIDLGLNIPGFVWFRLFEKLL